MNYIVQRVGHDVSHRARNVASEKDLGRVIFDAVNASSIDPRAVTAEDAKQLLMIALQSFRRRTNSSVIRFDASLETPVIA